MDSNPPDHVPRKKTPGDMDGSADLCYNIHTCRWKEESPMRLYRKPACLIWILCFLLFGMCFDSVGADSFSACHSLSAYPPSCEGGSLSGSAALHAQRRNPPVEQAYAPKAMGHGDSVLGPCQAMRRSPSRPGRGLVFAALSESSVSQGGTSARRADSPVGFHEVASNTVIISYIHRQDGEKA